jgi:hypothetical protein
MVIPMVIQSTRLVPSGSGQTDAASNVSRENPTDAVRSDAEHLPRNRKVEGSNLSSGSKTAAQRGISGIADGGAATGGHSFELDLRAAGAPARFAT